MTSGPDLAALLTGKPITTTRMRKVLRHLTSPEHYAEFLAALPADIAHWVDTQIGGQVKAKFA